MVLKEMSWRGVILCCLLYCLVFLAVRYEMIIDNPLYNEPRLGLLCFIIPGLVAGIVSRDAPLTLALTGALLATPFALLLLNLSYFATRDSFFQEVAFVASAVFWCGLGGLLVMLWRALFDTTA